MGAINGILMGVYAVVIQGYKFKNSKFLNFSNSNFKTCSMPRNINNFKIKR